MPALLLCAALHGALPVQAQGLGNEAQLAARIALALSRFAQWSSGAPAEGGTLRLCLAQRNAAVAQAFGALDGTLVNGRRIELRRAPPAEGCHVLFVHASAGPAAELLKAVAHGSALTIGDAEGFVAQGGMVELVAVNDALRFDVNLGVMRASQVALSAQALKLARQVRE